MSDEPTGFLYPFIESEERDEEPLLADLARSARAKMTESRALAAETVARLREELDELAAEMGERFGRGGRLFTFGNGGSATHALSTAALFSSPPHGRALPAFPLVEDRAVLTALANDVGYELVFSRQLIAHARPDDIAMGFSTSGGSVNVLQAFEEAARRGLLSIGLAGYEGGSMAASPHLAHCMVVSSHSVHRIQEAQDAVVFELWSNVQRRLGQGAGAGAAGGTVTGAAGGAVAS